MEYIVLIFHIAETLGMDDETALQGWLDQLVQLEEDLFIAGFHQCIENDWHKAWIERHIRNK